MSAATEDNYGGVPILEIDLIDNPNEEGQTRVALGDGRFAREASGFSVKIRELYAVHGTGTWDSKAEQFASLLIFRIKTVDNNPSRGRRIKNVEVRLRFKSAVADSLPKDDPYIVCFAPAQEHKIGLLPTSVLRSKHENHSISLDIDANPAPITGGAELGGDNSWDWEKDVWATIVGEGHQVPWGRGRLGENIVHWTISENEKAHQIMDTVDVGILLRRPNNSPFTVDFSEVKATVDKRYAVAVGVQEAINKGRGLISDESVPTKSHTYNPVKQGKWPASVTDKDLNLLEEGSELEKYTFMHILGRVRGIRYDGSGDQADANSWD
jgi:hypothetical protein